MIDAAGHGFLRRVDLHLPGGDPLDHAHVPLVNHVRAPALISGLLLLIYFPLILGPAGPGYLSATGHHPSGYLRNWLLITLSLFVSSAVIYALRVWKRRRSPAGTSPV
ncbi:MAG: hypothetical protein ACLP8S_25940 [Solirubrobacteraceae bacterium]